MSACTSAAAIWSVYIGPHRMRALRLRQLVTCLAREVSRVCEPAGPVRTSLAATARRSGGAAATGVHSRGLVVASCALYHKRNPFDFRVVREEGEDMPGVRNLDQSIDEMDETRKKEERGLDEAKVAALKLLGARSHSRKELKTKLLERGHELHHVRAALDRLAEVGLQSDADFAEVFVRSKWRQSKWGPRRIQLELHRRGVSEEVAEAALQSIFGEGLDVRQHLDRSQDEEDEDGQHGSSVDHAAPEQQLLEDARRQWGRMQGLAEEARRRRFVGWMQRRGHAWDNIRGLLHQLEKEDAQRAIDGDEP